MQKSNKPYSSDNRQQRYAKAKTNPTVTKPMYQSNQHQSKSVPTNTPKRRMLRLGILILVALLALGGLFAAFTSGSKSSGSHGGSGPTYVVGSPGPGAFAPPISLPSTSGGTFNLAAYRGQQVLLYFQEGVTCQPCWTQLQGIDANLGTFRALGITQVVSIAIDPASALREMVASNTITTPVLADSTGVVSNAYHTNSYGMMGASEDGHTFVLVSKTGKILWRADFGGPPHYTMYVPVTSLLSDLRAGLAHTRP
ncbi:peroxiredoxin family protein [Ferrimicrobium acidiphilum]|uniref:peroxiredoxin family protein n=1 Tax=Ferrimicrobium acidiphilum TaxID=121039 RepID=UPI0023F49C36|nr:redoxin domain-containing protein [Ferrimicrobium acidiphilum]